MKKIIYILLAVVLVVLFFVFRPREVAREEGLIYTCEELQAIRDDLKGYHKLGSDIYCDGFDFEPIDSFEGIFDGNGFLIYDLKIQMSGEDDVALFGSTKEAVISNLGLERVSINGKERVGSLVGNASYDTLIKNSYASGEVKGNKDVGGLIGHLDNSTIKDSYFVGNLSGIDNLGGLSGYLNSSSVRNSYSKAEIKGGSSVGGFVGYAHNSVVINSYTNSEVDGVSAVGGFIGSLLFSRVKNSYSVSDIEGVNTLGGFIGSTEDSTISVDNSYWLEGSGLEGVGDIDLPTLSSESEREAFFDREHPVYSNWNFVSIWEEKRDDYPLLSIRLASQFFVDNDDNGYWDISSCDELQLVSSFLEDDFELVQDIYCDKSKNFNPIGERSPFFFFSGQYSFVESFSAKFNGNGFTIHNLKIDRPEEDDVALFGSISGAEISNIKLEGSSIVGGSVVGSLVGYAESSTVINCQSHNGSVSGKDDVGGLIGHGSLIALSHSSVTVNGRGSVGGLAGRVSGRVDQSYSTGAVTGESLVGGLIGLFSGELSDCYSTGAVKGGRDTGGLLGLISEGGVTNCYSTGAVTAKDTVGGFVGVAEGIFDRSISNCYSTGVVTGESLVGGFIGGANKAKISNSYWLQRAGIEGVGGIVNRIFPDEETDIEESEEMIFLDKESPSSSFFNSAHPVYSSWDFDDVWSITEESYPTLRN